MRVFFIVLVMSFMQFQLEACSCSQTVSSIDLPAFQPEFSLRKYSFFSTREDEFYHGEILSERIREIKSTEHFQTRKKIVTIVLKLSQPLTNGVSGLLEVNTPYGSDACGFYAPVGSKVFISTSEYNGAHWTTSCHRSVSDALQPKRYYRYLSYMKSLKADKGEFNIYQTKRIYGEPFSTSQDSCLACAFSKKKGRMFGQVFIYDIDGILIEKGAFKKGYRHGVWMIMEYGANLDTYEEYYIEREYLCKKGDCVLIDY